jgi:hypothetical protein
MEEAGSVVVVHSADVSDAERMKQVIAQVTAEFGAIHGIIHAAGVPGGGIIQLKKPEAAKKVLEPKVKGVINLKEALGDARPDFVVLCSSINAITGGFGQVDYAAANAFMDAFAQANTKRRGTFYLSVNWDRWNETGMAVSMGAGSQGRGMVTKSITPCLKNALPKPLNRMFILQSTPLKNTGCCPNIPLPEFLPFRVLHTWRWHVLHLKNMREI